MLCNFYQGGLPHEAGNPIICAMGKGDFTSSGHYIVLVGTENGLVRVNDPNSYANSENFGPTRKWKASSETSGSSKNKRDVPCTSRNLFSPHRR